MPSSPPADPPSGAHVEVALGADALGEAPFEAFSSVSDVSSLSGDPFEAGGSQAETVKPASVSPPAPIGADALVGVVLSDRYRVLSLLGEGGMGAVYLAEHTHMHKRMAIKVLHPEMVHLPEVVARFEREAMAAAHIEHPNVAAATDFGKLPDGSFFLALEYIEGENLREVLAGGRLSLARTLTIVRQIVAALVRAHGLGIVHRDLKPENIMLVERDGERDFVKVLDFGIAKVPVGELTRDSSSRSPGAPVLTKAGMVYGTPEYMAPEQALGQEIDARVDLYSLGVMAYEMLCGVRPFDDESKVRLLGKHVTAAVPPMAEMGGADVPPEVAAAVMRLLAKEASDRTPDAKTLLEQLDGLTMLLVASGRLEGKLPTIVGGAAPTAFLGAGAPVAAISHPSAISPALPVGLGLRADRRVLLGVSIGVVALVGLALAVARPGATAIDAGAPTAAEQADAAVGKLELDPLAPDADVEAPITDPKLREGLAAMEAGDTARGVALLGPRSGEAGCPPQVHRALMTALKESDPKRSLVELERLVKKSPRARSGVDVLVVARDLALGDAAADEAFTVLRSGLGSNGIDVLYELAYGAYANQYPKARERARATLTDPAVRARADDALAVALDLRGASGCDLKPLLERAAKVGDRRSLTQLQAVAARRRPRRDPLACLRADGSLDKAIGAIQARARASAK
ncbi:MAG TPA: serine/threonine-protein kinase [Polyangiaceae bacterium]|nr:serine/threonine-protein kinase [Polyangiaceae bacterium]